jgi:hypothetical protein
MVAIAQLVEPRIVIPVVVGSSPISHPTLILMIAKVAELVDALASGVSVFGREGSSPSLRTNQDKVTLFGE